MATLSSMKFKERRSKIIKNGVEVTGIVFSTADLDISIQLDGFQNTPGRASLPTIRFVTKEGVWITGKVDEDASITYSLKEGRQIKVIYNAEKPEEFIYKTGESITLVLYYLSLIIGLGCFVAGLWFAYKYLTS